MPCWSQILRSATHELLGHHVEAAFALDRLDDDRRHLLGLDVGLEQLRDGLERIVHRHAVQRDRHRHVVDAGRERAEAGLVGRDLAGQRQAHAGAAMEGAAERDHAGAPGGAAGDLDRVLDRFGAGGEEGGLLGVLARRQRIDLLGQLDRALVGHDLVGGVGEALELLRRSPRRCADGGGRC